MTEDNNKDNNGFWAGLVVGGLIGAVAAYFLSSEDKEKLRKEIGKKGKLLLRNLEDFGQDAIDKGEEVKEAIEDKAELIEKKVQKLPKVAHKTIADVQEAAQTVGGNINATKKSFKKFFSKKGKSLAK